MERVVITALRKSKIDSFLLQCCIRMLVAYLFAIDFFWLLPMLVFAFIIALHCACVAVQCNGYHIGAHFRLFVRFNNYCTLSHSPFNLIHGVFTNHRILDSSRLYFGVLPAS